MAIPTFTAGTPQIGSTLGGTRDLIRDNIDGLFQTIAIDHFDNNNANAGKHKFVRMVRLVVNPTVGATEGSLFVKLVGTQNELFYKYGSSGNTFQVTNNGAKSSVKGFSSLVGEEGKPILIQWGEDTKNNGGTVTFASAFSSAVFSIQCTLRQNTTNRHFVYVRSNTLTEFTVTSLDSGGSSESNTFSWIAIGT